MSSVCFRCFRPLPSSPCSKDTHKPHHLHSLLDSESYSKPPSCFCFGLKQGLKKPSINSFPVTLYWIALPVLHLLLKLCFIYCWPKPTKHLPSIPFLLAYSGICTTVHFQVHPSHGLHMWAPHTLLTRVLKPALKDKRPLFKTKPQFQIVNFLPLILKSIFLGQWRETTSPKLLNDFGSWLNTPWQSWS